MLHYVFDGTRAHTHLVEVEIRLPAMEAPHLDFVLPAWLPGAYKIVDNARNVRRFKPAHAESGAPLRYERLDWQTWRVFTEGAPVSVRYGVFFNKPEIHQGQLNAHRAWLNPGTLGMYVAGHQEDWPVTLDLRLPAGWGVATALTGGEGRYAARDYEDFIDCPILAGEHLDVVAFEQGGARYEIAYEGQRPWDLEALVDPISRIIKAATDLMGPPPLTRYVFQYLETDAGFLNGLEHCTSTIITGPVSDPAQHDGLLTITAHEFFHLWNVKRLKPVGFGPFDYTREAHTTSLWVCEGFTEYFTDRLMLQAGLSRPEVFLGAITATLGHLHQMPGRLGMTLEEASWTTWHFGDDRWNGALNYYVKGNLLAACLDVEIRTATDGARSLDDAMRLLWERFGATDVRYRDSDVIAICEEVAGRELAAFWQTHLRSTEDPDYAAAFAKMGLHLLETQAGAALHLTPKVEGPLVKLENVLAGGAAQKAGLMIGDVLVAIDGVPAAEALATLQERYMPDETAEVHFFRRGRLEALEVQFGKSGHWTLMADHGADARTVARRQAWLARVPALAR